MIQQEEDNSILLNEYLEENSRRSQQADKAIQARANTTNLQKAAESFDPLTDQEPNTGNSDIMSELDTDTTNMKRPPAEEDYESSLVKITSRQTTRTRGYNMSSSLSKKQPRQQ